MRQPAHHIPPADYASGKHVKGATNEERKKNCIKFGDGQFLAELSPDDVERMEIEVLQSGNFEREREGGSYHLYKRLNRPVGYISVGNGAEVTYTMRAEITQAGRPEIHSHPRER